MDKYVNKNWSYCKRKRNREDQKRCILPTIEERYEIFGKKERVEQDDSFVEAELFALQGFSLLRF